MKYAIAHDAKLNSPVITFNTDTRVTGVVTDSNTSGNVVAVWNSITITPKTPTDQALPQSTTQTNAVHTWSLTISSTLCEGASLVVSVVANTDQTYYLGSGSKVFTWNEYTYVTNPVKSGLVCTVTYQATAVSALSAVATINNSARTITINASASNLANATPYDYVIVPYDGASTP